MEVADDLPQNEFDVIVVGTGMVESIVAAGVARIGKSVLHLDRNEYYGDFWATLGLESLQELTKKYSETHESVSRHVSDSISVDNCTVHPMTASYENVIRNVAYKWFIPSSLPEAECDTGSVEKKTEPLSVSDESNKIEEDSNISSNGSNDCKSIHQDNSETTDENSSKPLETSGPEEESQSLVDALSAGDKKDEKTEPVVIKKRWSIKELQHQSRKFNIDLAPKVIYSTGAMVDLLLRSCVYRYAEFQSVSNILARVGDDAKSLTKLERVPCTKSEVFSSRSVSVVDKRILMKVLNFCLNFTQDSPEYEELKEELFIDYLKREKVPNHLIQYIFYSIAMATNITLFKDAATRVQCFLKNVGRYGNSPFLWPMYGSGELLQAFCRLSAVYGGVYYLSRGAEAVLTFNETNACAGVISNSKVIKAKHVVTSSYYCPSNFVESTSKAKNLSRTILFTDRPMYSSDKEAISILNLPSKDGLATNPIVIIELPSCTGSSPKEIYTVHITYERSCTDWSEVKDIIDEMFVRSKLESQQSSDELIRNLTDETLEDWLRQSNLETDGEEVDASDSRPRILFWFHYDLMDSSCYTFSSSKPANLHLCHGPDSHIDFDRAINQAKEIFTQMYPDEDFLEPTPDPNDITLSDLIGEESQQSAAQEPSKPEISGENTSKIPPTELVSELTLEDVDNGESDGNPT